MSLKEQTIILTDKDSQGNTIMQFPITKAKNIEDVMSIAQGGTGANNATSALSNLGILDAIVNASVSGKTITFTKKDNTKFSIDTQDTNNGIVASLLKQNGYIKFANRLILQWGVIPANAGVVTWIYPIKFTSVYNLVTTRYAAYFDSSKVFSDKEMALCYINVDKCRINRGNETTERIYVIAIGQA